MIGTVGVVASGGLTAVLAAATVAVAGRSARWASRVVAAVLALAVAAAVLTALLVADPYPWSNAVVLAVAWSGGILYGRVPRPWFVAVLTVLALLDLASFTSGVQSRGGPGIGSGPALVGNITVLWTGGHFREGVGDIAVLAAAAVRWARTWRPAAVLLLALVAALAPWGLIAVGWRGGLPLVPFAAVVYALSVALARWPGAARWQRLTRAPAGALPPPGP